MEQGVGAWGLEGRVWGEVVGEGFSISWSEAEEEVALESES